MSLQSSQMGTNFSGGNGVFDSYNDKTNNLNPNKEYSQKTVEHLQNEQSGDRRKWPL